jgi:hypothetical protein
VIKHDVSKFCGAYGFCFNNKESGQSLDNILQAALLMYKQQNLKNQSFVYLHCWLILKEHLRWMEMPGERLQRGPPVHLSDGDQEVQAGSLDGEEGEADMVGEGEDNPAQPTAAPPPTPTIASARGCRSLPPPFLPCR